MKTIIKKQVDSYTSKIILVAAAADASHDGDMGDILEVDTAERMEILAESCGVEVAMIRTLMMTVDCIREAVRQDLEDLHARIEALEKGK